MSQILNFPHQLHRSFADLVYKEITQTAHREGKNIEQYIQEVYFEGNDPKIFQHKISLTRLYQRYANLVESTLSTIEFHELMSKATKVYLCYRIYLHGMAIKRQVKNIKEAKSSLILALRDYFYSHGKPFQLNNEMAVMKLIGDYCGQLPDMPKLE